MTREEEIVKAAKEFENRSWFSDIVHSKVSRGVDSACGIGFLEGAVWADENPESKYNLSDIDYIAGTLKSIVELAEQTTSENVAFKIAAIKFQANMVLKCINEI